MTTEPSIPDLALLAERFATCEFTSLDRAGHPVTWPLAPFPGEAGRTIDVSTGLSYPAKAERARWDPRVSILFSNPTASGLDDPPVVLVQGLATVWDRDLQANADRYARLSMGKLWHAWRGVPRWMIRRHRWYFSRIWVLVTPLEVWWWAPGGLDLEPWRWSAPAGTEAPASDPAPPGGRPEPWRVGPADWRPRAAAAAGRLGPPVLTVVDAGGFPFSILTGSARFVPDGFELEVPRGVPVELRGAACLTFHRHENPFVGQENASFVGTVEGSPGQGRARFRVDRVLPDFSLPGPRARRALAFVRAAVPLSRRLRREAARRGQRVPVVNLPARFGR